MGQLVVASESLHSFCDDLPQFALTKTILPPVGKPTIERHRLLAELDAFATRRLILFKAPAGYGKTTLAATWGHRLKRGGSVVAWLSLDGDDNEPSTFAYHLAKAAERAAPDLGRESIELLRASSLIPPQTVISSLVNSASESDTEIFLILDDYHVVDDRRCHDLTALLLRYAPSNLHLVVLTRTEPRLPLSRLRLDDGLGEIDASDLHFDVEETGQLLGPELCSSLQPSGVATLYAATEGWPAALQLARISLRGTSDPLSRVRVLSGTTHNISEYLEDTLSSLPDDVVDFLLRISILDQMNGSLCKAVSGVYRSGVLLARLERQQFLLIPLDEAGNCYRFHHLMREFLADQLKQRMGAEVAGLHRRAYAWYADAQQWTQAVQHAIAAKDFDRALEFVSRCAMSLVVRGDLLTLLAWERQLPAALMSGQLEVKLALAWGMALVTRFKEADRLFLQVETAPDLIPESDLWWRCKAARAIYYALTDDSARGRDLASECLEGHRFDPFNFNALCNVARYDLMKAGEWAAFDDVPRPDPSHGEASYVLPENYRLCLCGMAAAQKLQVDEALELYARARVLADKHVGPMSVAATMATGLTARMIYERGDICGAEVSALDSLELIETTAFHEGFLQAFLVIARAASVRGDRQRAASLLNRAERLSWERGWGRVVAMLLVERTRLLLQDGNLQGALSLLQAFEHLKAHHAASRRCSWTEIDTADTIAKGLIASATGHVEDAVALLQVAYDDLASVQNRLDGLRVGLDLCVALAQAGARDRCFDLLKELLEQAAPQGLSSLFLEGGTAVAHLLLEAKEQGLTGGDGQVRAFVDDLLAYTEKTNARQPESKTAGKAATRLTDRERAIVGFIAAGNSNKEIARELGVAPETVKTHVKRIFNKLSAETRAQAVVRAQSLGMLGNAGRTVGAHHSSAS